MDALKKAEQDKKKAAEKLKNSAGQDQPESVEQPSAEAASEQGDIDTRQSKDHPEEKKPSSTPPALTLEPIEDKGDITDEFTIIDEGGNTPEDSDLKIAMEILSSDRTGENEFEQTGKQPIPGSEPSLADALRDDIDDVRMEETFYGVELASDDTSAAMYEETLQGEPYAGTKTDQVYDETLPGVSAVELARDIGDENQPTPVAAQTIFAASASRRTPSGYKWTALIVIVLIISAAIAIGVLDYQSKKITPRDLKSPLVARGIEDIVPSQPIASVISEPVTGTLIEEKETQQSGSGTVAGLQQPVELPAVESSVTQQETPVTTGSGEESITPPETMPVTGLDISKEGALAQASEQPPAVAAVTSGTSAPVAQNLPEEIEVMPALFKISRSKGPDRHGEVINEAYAAYQQGDYEIAKEMYERILKDFPDSRDGLLGLGAIAMYERDWEKAYVVYSRLLILDPKNNIARTALINLAGESGQIDRESTIKLMLHENPESSFLYFSLGNVYASQHRWAEAQQAFFDAYRYDSTNPVYALNLAIALDRLGQTDAALDYYNTAIKLSEGKQGGFDEARILARIETISGALN